MLVRASSGSGGGGTLSHDSVSKSANQSLVLNTENCMVVVNNGVPSARSIMEALVYGGSLVIGEAGSYGTISYNSTTKELTVTGTLTSVSTYAMEVFGDYTITS